MFDFEIARYLYRVAFLYNIFHDSAYKSRAYFKAALSIDGYSSAVTRLNKNDELRTLPHIGVSIEKNIKEILETGSLHLIHELLGDIPSDVFELYEHTNITERLLKKIFENKIYSFKDLKDSVEKRASFFSDSDLEVFYQAITHYYTKLKFQYAHAIEIANELVDILKDKNLVENISVVGGLRRKEDLVSKVEIIYTSDYSLDSLLKQIKKLASVVVESTNKETILVKRFSIPFEITMVSKDEYYYQLAVMTGGKSYGEAVANIPHELKSSFKTENEVLRKAGLKSLNPALRSDARKDYITASQKSVVKRFNGDLHLHTDWSDGLHSIEQMRDMAIKMGYKYIAITDHSQSLKPSGMSELDTLTQIKTIRELNKTSKIPILSGIEVDILADGSLDLPENILREFDIVIASIHSHFNQSPFELMERISKALTNKHVNIFAHPTCRLLGRPGKISVQREELYYDFDYLLSLCIENDVALEINSFPERFDLSLSNVLKAVSAGVKVSVGTDAHSMYHMDCANYSLEALREAKISSDMVLNCLSYEELKEYLKLKRKDEDDRNLEHFAGMFKDFNYYFSNNADILSGKSRVVGIDLTGSEEKASGYAVLEGCAVTTELVFTDDEMIERILAIQPTVVSIDSPLSLPEGRCCGDKNCECAKYGIMRYCELMLKRFGIGVYPCLIDSMVNLTMRGMKLAEKIRSRGITVIESYPGVAQDLLHIPRKRKGLDLLVNGMKNFGIHGIKSEITHDEVDAITSALVGYFYLNNQYVGMGNEKEDYLIVPKLETALSNKKLAIGLVGHIAAGKTTTAEYLRFKHGFISMRFSKLIEDLYGVSGRDELQRIGLELAEDPEKQRALSEYMIKEMNGNNNYVIDGIRQKEDLENLSRHLGNGFVLVAIEASATQRLNRHLKMFPEIPRDDFIAFCKHPVERAIDYISMKSNFTITNNKGYNELMNQTDSILKKLSN